MFINDNPVGWELQGRGVRGGWLACFVLLYLIAGCSTEAERGGRLGSSHLGKSRSSRPRGGRQEKVNQAVFKIYLLGPGGVGDFNVIPSLRHSLESEKRKGYLLFLDP